ncbi:MAG: dienelactone hydrolase family protein, partial [Maricaulaceae bacterium]
MLIEFTVGLLAQAGGLIHPETPPANPPAASIESFAPPTPPDGPPASAEPEIFEATGRPLKTGLTVEDYAYEMPEGVTTSEVVYYSDGIACYAKIFFPADFDPEAEPGVPAVVMGQGWAGSHISIEKYGARFAEHGLVAMTIDYRGWGFSDGYPTVISLVDIGGGIARDESRHEVVEAEVWERRTRLLPRDQQDDYRAAISYIQGEPGVDPDRIGVWGSSFAGGNSVAVAGQDARVKAIAIQVPSVTGDPEGLEPVNLGGPLLADSIRRARTGSGGEAWTGFSAPRLIDFETFEALQFNNTMQWAANIGDRPFMV